MTLNKKILLPVLVLAVVVVAFVFMVTRQQATAPTVQDGTGDSIEQIDSDMDALEHDLDQMDSDMDDIEDDIDALEQEMENQ